MVFNKKISRSVPKLSVPRDSIYRECLKKKQKLKLHNNTKNILACLVPVFENGFN